MKVKSLNEKRLYCCCNLFLLCLSLLFIISASSSSNSSTTFVSKAGKDKVECENQSTPRLANATCQPRISDGLIASQVVRFLCKVLLEREVYEYYFGKYVVTIYIMPTHITLT